MSDEIIFYNLKLLFFKDCDWGRKYLAQSEINVELLKQIDLMREKMKQLAEIEPNETGLNFVIIT